MNRILCSTGALIGRPNGRNFRLLESVKDKISVDGFEFMMYDSWYGEKDELVNYLKTLNLNIPVMHFEKSIGEIISQGDKSEISKAFNKFEINASMAQRLGINKAVLHLWGGIPSDRNFENNINAYPKLKEIAENYGITLLIENVICNNLDPLTRLKELSVIYRDIKFVFDTKMAQFHRQMPLIYKEENNFLFKENRVEHIHLNDYKGEYMDFTNLKVLPVGDGDVDFKSFFEYLKSVNYKGDFTMEATAFNKLGEINTGMINKQKEKIQKEFKNAG